MLVIERERAGDRSRSSDRTGKRASVRHAACELEGACM
jgi:hypothetical protein